MQFNYFFDPVDGQVRLPDGSLTAVRAKPELPVLLGKLNTKLPLDRTQFLPLAGRVLVELLE